MATKQTHLGAIKALQKELMELNAQPVEGFKVNVSNVEDMFIWDVSIFGPPMTLYEGGYFKARLSFPPDYPYSPPSIRFLSKMFHPNIYENGEVCISILHSPGDDPQSGELAAERWNPTQNVRGLVQITHEDAKKDGVEVPTTLKDYCFSGRPGDDLDQSDLDKDLSDFDDDYGYFPSDVDEDDVNDDDDDDNDEEDDDDAVAPHTNDDAGARGQVVASPSRHGRKSKPRLDAGSTDSALEEAETEPRGTKQQQTPCTRHPTVQGGQSSKSS